MDKRQSILAILAFIVLLCTLLTHQFGTRKYQKLADARRKADQYKDTLNQILQCITDAETGHRGYLLADNEDYKQAYERAINQFPIILDRLESLYDRQTIFNLVRLLRLRLDKLHDGVILFDAGKKEQAIVLIKTDEGKKLMESCRVEIVTLKAKAAAEENELEIEFQITSYWLSNGLGIAHLVAIILIALAMIPKSGLINGIREKP